MFYGNIMTNWRNLLVTHKIIVIPYTKNTEDEIKFEGTNIVLEYTSSSLEEVYSLAESYAKKHGLNYKREVVEPNTIKFKPFWEGKVLQTNQLIGRTDVFEATTRPDFEFTAIDRPKEKNIVKLKVFSLKQLLKLGHWKISYLIGFSLHPKLIVNEQGEMRVDLDCIRILFFPKEDI